MRRSRAMAEPQRDYLWALAHAERAALAEELSGLSAAQWRHGTLCGRWDVEEVGARFRPDVHNQRRLVEHRDSTPAETLDRFRAVMASTTAPSAHIPAYLGEVLVHAEDIRRPLGLARTPSVEALTPVAAFFARRDFAVASRTHIAGLHLRADDGPFIAGSGSLV